jgi:hypothetical protein
LGFDLNEIDKGLLEQAMSDFKSRIQNLDVEGVAKMMEGKSV